VVEVAILAAAKEARRRITSKDRSPMLSSPKNQTSNGKMSPAWKMPKMLSRKLSSFQSDSKRSSQEVESLGKVSYFMALQELVKPFSPKPVLLKLKAHFSQFLLPI
jgi:hypothetical protein